ncbi:MAG: hypothetical protein D6805_07670 [Planctomycetota bacterium]|nr:MAG: hypothetical protein D6805_07670 [Planctomycetota bacterium]
MDAYQIIELISFFAGLLICALLIVQVASRKRRTTSGRLFFFLLLALILWNFGNFATNFLDDLFGDAQLDNPDLIFINSSFSIFAVLGLSLIPSLLLHTLVSLFFDKELNFQKTLQQWIQTGIYLIYFPLLLLPIAIRQLFLNNTAPYYVVLKDYIFPFQIWLSSSLLMAGLICFKLSNVGWEREERNMFHKMGWLLLLISTSITAQLLLSPSQNYTHYLILTSSLAPIILFTYYVYRYNYLDFTLRRSTIYSLVVTTIVLFYLFGVQTLTQYINQHYELETSMLQSLLILALVFAFRPFRTHTADVLDKFFFKERELYKSVYRELTQQMRGGRVKDLPSLLRHIVETLKKNMEIEHASLVFFEKNDSQHYRITAATLPFKIEDFHHILHYIQEHGIKILTQFEVDDEHVLRQMENISAHTILPIYDEEKLLGLLTLGKKTNNRRIHTEELDMLLLLTSQLTTEIQNMHLVEEKVKLERQLLRNEKFMALGRLSASVAHQVKNPLSSIKIITQVLKEDLEENDPREEDLSLIIQEVNKLTRVVNQLLDFAKPNQQEKDSHCLLHQVVDEVVLLMHYEAKQKNIQIQKEIDPSLPPVRGDRITLQDIFSNLVQNSIQAIKSGGYILIKSHYPALPLEQEENLRTSISKNTITVEIQDNGEGIPPKHLKNIFEPFFTTKPQGTGLGLPIVRQRIQALGGYIQIKSPPPQPNSSNGTSVLLWLPTA